MNGKKNSRAFTLVEMVVVIAVIAIISVVLVPSFVSILSRSRMNDNYEKVTNSRDEFFFDNEELATLSDMRGYLFMVDGEIYEVSSTGELILSDYDIDEYELDDYNEVTQYSGGDSSVTIYVPTAVSTFDRALRARNHYHTKNGLVEINTESGKKALFYEMNHYIITVFDSESNQDVNYEVTYSQNSDGTPDFEANGKLVLTEETIESLEAKGLIYKPAAGQELDSWQGIIYVPTEETRLSYRIIDLEANLADSILWDDIELGFDDGNVKQSDYVFVVQNASGITLTSSATVTKGVMYTIDPDGIVYEMEDSVLADIRRDGYRFLASNEIPSSDLLNKVKTSNQGSIEYAKIDCYAIFYGYYNDDTSYADDGYHLWTDFLAKYNGGVDTDTLTYNAGMSEYSIKRLIVSDSITTIGNGAFVNYNDLTDVILPESLTDIEIVDTNPFANGKVRYIKVNDRNDVYYGYNNSGIVDLATQTLVVGTRGALVNDQYLPEEILQVGKYAFEKSDLVQLNIIGITVEEGAFKDNTDLVSVIHNLESVPDELFCGCTSLRLVSSLIDVTSVGDRSFEGCSLINDEDDAESSLEFSTMLTSIGTDAFKDNNIKLYYGSSKKTFRLIDGYENTNHMTIIYALKDVTYDLQGGEIPEGSPANPLIYNPNSSDELTLTSPVKSGCIFTSWSVTETDGSEVFNDITPSDSPINPYKLPQGEEYNYKDITLTANYERIVFDIVYMVNGEDVTSTLDNQYPKSFNKLSTDALFIDDLTRNYYDFDGWYDGETFIDNTLNPYNRTETAVLTATFVPHAYTISYDYRGGSADNPGTYTIETETFTLTRPLKEDYTFVSWYDRTEDFNTEDITIVQGSVPRDMVLDAVYTPTNYTLTYKFMWEQVELTSIENSLSNPVQFTVESGTIWLTKPDDVPGYDFTGWKVGNNALENGRFVCANYHGNTTIIGTYTPWVYEISFGNENADTGTRKDEVILNYNNNTTYYYGQDKYLEVPALKNGYSFAGWRGLAGAASWVVAGGDGSYYIHNATSNFTVLARWELVTYDINYEIPTGANEVMPNPIAYTVEDDDITLYDLTRTGYNFAGWTGSNGNIPTKGLVINCSETFGSKTYYSNWTTVEYTITYNNLLNSTPTNGGNPATYTIESDTFTLNNPERVGYDFEGWTGTNISTATTSVTIVKGSYGARTYTANWTPIIYTISYELNGGENDPQNKQEYTIEYDTFTIVELERSGYEFLGWTGTGLDEATDSFDIETGTIGNKVYEAQWELIIYTITYNLCGGTEYPSTPPTFANGNPETYTVNDDTFTLENPVALGYTFIGWQGTGLGVGNSMSMEVVLTKGRVGNRSYTAFWTINTYTIAYDYVDGVLGEGEENPASYTVEDDSFTLYNPTKTGYTFGGWTGTGITLPVASLTITKRVTVGNKEFVATWTPIVYTLTINLYGGTGMASTTYTIESDSINIPMPTKSGYEFLGWVGTNGDEPDKNITIITGSIGDRTYNARWELLHYTITYSLNGGIVAGTNPTIYDVTFDDIYLINPTKLGFEFKGWKGTNGTEVEDAFNVVIESGSTGNRSYRADWDIITYSIAYVSEFGGLNALGNPGDFTVESDSFTLNNPSKLGYTFAGWTDGLYEGKEDDGYTVVMGIPTKTVTIIPSNNIGSRTYTANWDVIVYTINYTLNDGMLANPYPTTYTVDDDPFTIPSPTRPYYRFDGWSGTGIGNGTTDLNTEPIVIAQGSTGNLSYTAHWTLMRFDIYYHEYTNMAEPTLWGLDYAKIAEEPGDFPSEYYSDNETFRLINPSKVGYNFAGWIEYTPHTDNVIANASTAVYIHQGDEGDKEFGATWSVIVYTISYTYNNGSVSSSNPTNYNILTPTITLTNPTRTGYIFTGWTGSNGSTPELTATINEGSTENKSFTANYTPRQYTVYLNPNNGTETIETIIATYDSAMPSVTPPTRTGYTFKGYYYGTDQYITASGGSARVWRYDEEGRTLYGDWTPNPYYVTFDKQSGTGGSPGVTATYEQPMPTSGLTAPSRTGYNFKGYYLNAGGSGLQYYTASMTSEVCWDIASTATIYAYWTVINYTITYNLNGGSASNNPTSYNIETPTFTLNNPTKDGNKFTGWTGSGSGMSVSVTQGSTGDKTFNATWSPEIGPTEANEYSNHAMNNGYADRFKLHWKRTGSTYNSIAVDVSVYYPDKTGAWNAIGDWYIKMNGENLSTNTSKRLHGTYKDSNGNVTSSPNCYAPSGKEGPCHGYVIWSGSRTLSNGSQTLSFNIGVSFNQYTTYNAKWSGSYSIYVG